MNEQEEFLKDLKGDTERFDILTAPLIPEEKSKEDDSKEDDEDEKGAVGEQKGETEDDDLEAIAGIKPRNRQERRRLEKLAADRESAIFLQGKLAAREEAKESVTEEGDWLKSVERIYGTDTPEAQLATDLLKKAVLGARDDAKAQALAEMRSEMQARQTQDAEADTELDGFVEEIEDTYNVRLTEAQEQGYFKLLEKMSPKDAKGNVIEYADPHAVWEVYQERAKARGSATNNRAKQLSDRSMTASGASQGSALKDDAATRFLRSEGII